MNEQTEGIVIDQIDYKDNDAIVTVYCKQYGKLSFYVKGYKKITSKNVYATQLFDYSEFLFDFNENKKLHILKTATLKNEYAKIKSDYDKLSIASVIVELIKIIEEDDNFDFLKETLDNLENNNEPYMILNLYLAQILKQIGIEPFVDGCTICNSTNNLETISIDEGGFICRSCNCQIHAKTYPVDLLRKFRIINKANFEVIDKIYNIGLNDFALTNILMEFLSMFLDINLKSYKSLINLNK